MSKKRQKLSFWKKAFIVPCVVLQAIFFFILPFHVAQKKIALPPKAFIHYLDIDSDKLDPSFEEFAVFFDSEALFLPTQWNYANNVDLPKFEDRLPLFDSFPPLTSLDIWTFEKSTLSPSIVPHPTNLLENKYWNILSTFGQNIQEISPSTERAAFVRVVDLQSGQNVTSFSIPKLENLDQVSTFWESAVFLVLIEPRGMIGLPLMKQSSGIKLIDNALKTYLSSTDLFSKLKSGYYSIVFNP